MMTLSANEAVNSSRIALLEKASHIVRTMAMSNKTVKNRYALMSVEGRRDLVCSRYEIPSNMRLDTNDRLDAVDAGPWIGGSSVIIQVIIRVNWSAANIPIAI